MKQHTIQTALALALLASFTVHAQEAVQWNVSDGGNGHWYGLRQRGTRSWTQLEAACRAEGGHLTTMNGPAERDFLVSVMVGNTCAIGGVQTVTAPQDEPAQGWGWATGEPMAWTNWAGWEPGNTDSYGAPEENVMGCFANGIWVDLADHLLWTQHYLIEWDADCNSDGIIDYGQILQSQLADIDTNGIPDICEPITCDDIDLNLNGIVEGGDLGVLLAFWGPVSPAFPRADIDRDGLVNGADLGILLAFWGPCPN